MFKGKCRLAAAALTLFAAPALAGDSTGGAAVDAGMHERLSNPALPSPDDLVRFDHPNPAAKIIINEIGANQRAFPLLYGAPATLSASPVTAAAIPQTAAAPTLEQPVADAYSTAAPDAANARGLGNAADRMIETGQPVLSAGGVVARTNVAAPQPEVVASSAKESRPEPLPATPDLAGTLRPDASEKSSGHDVQLRPDAPSSVSEDPHQTSVAAAMPHPGSVHGETAPPILGTVSGPDTEQMVARERAAPVAAASAALALAPAPIPRDEPKRDTAAATTTTTAPTRPIRPEPESAEGESLRAANQPSDRAHDLDEAPAPGTALPDTTLAVRPGVQEFTPGAKDTIPEKPASPAFKTQEWDDYEPAFPMTSITPPPIPSTGSPATGASDSQPTVGLAEFRGVKALDGTPLPPPPPVPELPGRPGRSKEPVAPKADPAQVRADFNRLKAFCEEDSLGSAAEIYAHMPDFGPNEEVNRLRADAANLLILGLARNDNLRAARRIFDSVPSSMAGHEANLAKTRGIINLATYYVRAERFTDAYDILMELRGIEDRSSLNNELFRLMARMIPYLDNADETAKATQVYDMLVAEIGNPGTASLFADNIHGVLKYYLHYVDRSENPVARRKRMDFLEHMYSSLAKLKDNPEIRMIRGTVGMSLADRYSGDPDRAAQFLEN